MSLKSKFNTQVDKRKNKLIPNTGAEEININVKYFQLKNTINEIQNKRKLKTNQADCFKQS